MSAGLTLDPAVRGDRRITPVTISQWRKQTGSSRFFFTPQSATIHSHSVHQKNFQLIGSAVVFHLKLLSAHLHTKDAGSTFRPLYLQPGADKLHLDQKAIRTSPETQQHVSTSRSTGNKLLFEWTLFLGLTDLNIQRKVFIYFIFFLERCRPFNSCYNGVCTAVEGGGCYFGPFLQYHGQPLGEPVIPGRAAVLNPGLKIWPPAKAAFYIPKKKSCLRGRS